MDRSTLLHLIEELFSKMMNKSNLGSAVNDHRSKIQAEATLKPVLEIIFDCNLENTNMQKSNYPGIDLVSEDERIGFQITADTSKEKIKDSIDKCISTRYKIYEKIDRLIVILLADKPKYHNKGINKSINNFKFDKDKDIIDFRDLYRLIYNFDLKKIEKIYFHLQRDLENDEEYFSNVNKLRAVNETFSPNWKITQYGSNFLVSAKHADAAKVQPIQLNGTITFHETPEGQKEQQQLQDLLEKGFGPCKIENASIEGFEYPDFFPDYYRRIFTNQMMILIPLPNLFKEDKEIRVVLEDIDGSELFSTEKIILKVTRAGAKEIEHSNAEQNTPIKLGIIGNSDLNNNSFQYSFSLHTKGFGAKELALGCKFFNTLKKCHTISIRDFYDDHQLFLLENTNIGQTSLFMENLQKTYEALHFFERKYRTRFSLPDEYLPPQQIDDILYYYAAFTDGYAVQVCKGFTIDVNKDFIEQLHPAPAAYAFFNHYPDEDFQLFGQTFKIGNLMIVFPVCQVNKESYENAVQFFNDHTSEEFVNIRFEPVEYNKIWTFAKDYHKLEVEFESNKLLEYVLQQRSSEIK
ncbi:MAG: SMEK domain-containing protein [Candidatus Kapaibacterium sp.]